MRRAIDERSRLSYHTISSDRGDRVPCERSEEKIVPIARPNDGWCVRHRESGDLACGRGSGDRRVEAARNPEIAVRPGRDRPGRINSSELRDLTSRRNATELADRPFHEPDIAIRSESHVAGEGIWRGGLKLSERLCRQLKAPDCMVGLIAKPDIAIGAGSDSHTHAKEGKLKLRDFPWELLFWISLAGRQ